VNIIGMRTTGQLKSNLQYYASAPLSEDEYRELLTHAP
jgi:aryl-alcohol dehydrogenase-like predicted oxidoreductase